MNINIEVMEKSVPIFLPCSTRLQTYMKKRIMDFFLQPQPNVYRTTLENEGSVLKDAMKFAFGYSTILKSENCKSTP